MTTAVRTYRQILRDELENRCVRNPRYSLRAFARDLGITAPRLSHVLKGDHGLSSAAAKNIAHRLGWNSDEQQLFHDLVESAHARSMISRKAAETRLATRETRFHSLEADAFKVIADWYHLSILELTRLEGFQSDENWIARKLGITIHETRAAIERLTRLEMLKERDGRLTASDDFSVNLGGVPSEAVRKFHRQVLEKALLAIDRQSIEERDLSTMVIAVDQSELPRAKAAIKDFRRKFSQEFSGPGRKNSVYCLGTQFFRLEEKNL